MARRKKPSRLLLLQLLLPLPLLPLLLRLPLLPLLLRLLRPRMLRSPPMPPNPPTPPWTRPRKLPALLRKALPMQPKMQ
ncbi:hypothetical protein CAP2UW1_1375 [Candidatus Accumulibacter phosphatis]|uniref:Uncharacterized protein n=1 Tax=Accumulibacter regalis TaxID=522306 RepID=C7RSI6_ACCRE